MSAGRRGQFGNYLDITTWHAHSACRDEALDWFFNREGETRAEKEVREYHAKAICGGCPVRVECGEYAMETNQRAGIWGGMTMVQRARLRKKRTRQAAAGRKAGAA